VRFKSTLSVFTDAQFDTLLLSLHTIQLIIMHKDL